MAALRALVGTGAQKRSSTGAGSGPRGLAALVALLGVVAACSPRTHERAPWRGQPVAEVLAAPDAGVASAAAVTVRDAGLAGDAAAHPAVHGATLPGAVEPAFTLEAIERKPSEAYPCTECHDDEMETDPKPRAIEDHAEIVLRHGAGRFWCLECHDTEDRDKLARIGGKLVPFERADQVCAKCHFEQQRDFVHGAHGKRIGRWRGERVISACVACHDPHAPAIAPRRPMPGPGAPGAAGRARKEPR